jgi:iron-sulfur cluster assembly protein
MSEDKVQTTPPADTEAGGEQGSKPTTKAVIAITERAAKEVQRVIEENEFDPDATWVRIGAKGGGCSGLTYVLDFDQTGPTEFDLTYEQHGVRLVIDKKSSFFMTGTELDFNDGLLDRGFVFRNPAATGSCGCGTSFSV